MLLLTRCYSSARVAGKGLPVAWCPLWLAVWMEGHSSTMWAPLCPVASVLGQENGSAAFILLLGRAPADGCHCLGAAGALELAVTALPAPGQLCAVPCLHRSCWLAPALPSLTLFILLLLFLLCSSTPNFAASP